MNTVFFDFEGQNIAHVKMVSVPHVGQTVQIDGVRYRVFETKVVIDSKYESYSYVVYLETGSIYHG